MPEVDELWASLGLHVDRQSWKRGDDVVAEMESLIAALSKRMAKGSVEAKKLAQIAADLGQKQQQQAAANRAINRLLAGDERDRERQERARVRAEAQAARAEARAGARRDRAARAEERARAASTRAQQQAAVRAHRDEMRRAREKERAEKKRLREEKEAERERARRRKEGSISGGGLLAIAGAYVGGRAAYSALIEFNATAEETKVQIAGMLALAKKTDLSTELKTADELYASLQRRAASLPGETSEYVAMAGKLARVISDNGGSVKDLEDLTVNAVVAGKGLGEQWEVVARDVEQALMGRYNTTDPFLSKVLPSIGYKGEEGREKWRALGKKKQFEELRRALLQPQITQLAEQQGKTFNGRLSQLKDQIKLFFGEVGKPLFEGLKNVLERLSSWIDKNKDGFKEVAQTIGSALVSAFEAVGAAIGFFIEHAEIGEAVLFALIGLVTAFAVKAAVAWLAVAGPIAAVVAVVATLIFVIRKAVREPDKLKAAFARSWEAIKGALRAAGAAIWEALLAVGRRIRDLFIEDLPNAIRAAFRAAFEYLADLPVFKQVIWALDKAGGLLRRGGKVLAGETAVQAAVRGGGLLDIAKGMARNPTLSSPSMAPVLTSGIGGAAAGAAAAAAKSMTIGQVNMSISTPNADPQAVGKIVKDELAATLRQAMDDQ